jgi:excisionase family DNA binding protein
MSQHAVSEIHATASELDQLAAVQRIVAEDSASVQVAVGGDVVELPRSLIRLLVAGADALGDGDSVALVSEESELSPAEAARVLGVSRQYVDRLVATGVLPARRLPQSRYRRIPARAVLAHRTSKEAKRAGIAAILEAADGAGLDY